MSEACKDQMETGGDEGVSEFEAAIQQEINVILGHGEEDYQTPDDQEAATDELTADFSKLSINFGHRVEELQQTISRLHSNEGWLLDKVQNAVQDIIRKAKNEKLRFRAMVYAFSFYGNAETEDGAGGAE